MRNALKAMLIGFGLVAATGAIAQAQSVSALPPNAPSPDVASPQRQTPYTMPYGSTQSFYPKPGGSEIINEGTSQPPATPSQGQVLQPYSMGPKLN